MNTVNAVFFRRMTDDWKFQYQVFRMAVDWTIALYIVAPLILIGAYHYYTWWQITPDWLLNIPFGWALIPLFLYAWTGSLRLFFLEADLLFFIHDRRWSQGLIRRGTAYSLLLHLFWTLVAFFLVAPFFLIYYSLSLFSFGLLFLFVYMMKASLSIGKQIVDVISSGGLERTSFYLLLLVGSGMLYFFNMAMLMKGDLFLIPGLVLLALVLIFLTWIRLHLKGSFFADVIHERKERVKYIGFLLGIAMVNPNQSQVLRRRRPLFFRHSRSLFQRRTPANGLTELGIKTFLRNSDHFFSYLRAVAVSIFAIVQIPFVLKWLLWLIVGLYLAYWCKNFWADVESASFLQLFRLRREDRQQAREKVIGWLMLPGFLLISMILGWLTYSWIGVLMMLPLCFLYSFLLKWIMGSTWMSDKGWEMK